jgi:hypothetical protein
MLKISAAIFSPPASRNKQLADEMSAKPEFRANQNVVILSEAKDLSGQSKRKLHPSEKRDLS